MSIYTDNGFKSRRDYLEHLSESLQVDLETVKVVAELYGPTEDFDGLVTTLEDISASFD